VRSRTTENGACPWKIPWICPTKYKLQNPQDAC
jgi:hypothetical protein